MVDLHIHEVQFYKVICCVMNQKIHYVQNLAFCAVSFPFLSIQNLA